MNRKEKSVTDTELTGNNEHYVFTYFFMWFVIQTQVKLQLINKSNAMFRTYICHYDIANETKINN